jgi:hypothetical protein
LDESVIVLEFQAKDARSTLLPPKGGIQNEEVVSSGKETGNIKNQREIFKP